MAWESAQLFEKARFMEGSEIWISFRRVWISFRRTLILFRLVLISFRRILNCFHPPSRLEGGAAWTHLAPRILQSAGKRAHISPSKPLLRGLTQQVSRVKHRQRGNRATVLDRVSEPRAARAQNPSLDAQERLSARRAETDQELRVGELDLPRDERQAGLGLLQRRRSIARRAPRNDIGDIHLPSIESDGVQHAIQQLP